MLLPLHSMMIVGWVAVPRPDTHRTLISLGAVGSCPMNGVVYLGVGGAWNHVLLPFTLVAERRWCLSFVLALPLPLPNLCLQCYQRR